MFFVFVFGVFFCGCGCCGCSFCPCCCCCCCEFFIPTLKHDSTLFELTYLAPLQVWCLDQIAEHDVGRLRDSGDRGFNGHPPSNICQVGVGRLLSTKS